MLFNIHKQEENATENRELTALRNELKEITAEEHMLFGKALAERYQPEKEKIIQRRGEVYKRKMEIQIRLKEIAESAAPAKLTALLKANRNDTLLKNEGVRIKILEFLELEICFIPCGHMLKITLPELFRLQTHLQANTQLLAFWQRTIEAHEHHSKVFQCPECIKQRKKHSETFHATSRKPIGTARITVEVI